MSEKQVELTIKDQGVVAKQGPSEKPGELAAFQPIDTTAPAPHKPPPNKFKVSDM